MYGFLDQHEWLRWLLNVTLVFAAFLWGLREGHSDDRGEPGDTSDGPGNPPVELVRARGR